MFQYSQCVNVLIHLTVPYYTEFKYSCEFYATEVLSNYTKLGINWWLNECNNESYQKKYMYLGICTFI